MFGLFRQNVFKVLLIEDDLEDQILVQRYLSQAPAKFEVQIEETIQTGVETLRDNPFDVVVLDLGLPDSYGLDTVKRVREEFSELPIIVLSGFQKDDLLCGSTDVEIDAFLTKGLESAQSISTTIIDVVSKRKTHA